MEMAVCVWWRSGSGSRDMWTHSGMVTVPPSRSAMITSSCEYNTHMGKYRPTLNYIVLYEQRHNINSKTGKWITLLDKSKLVKRCTSDPIQAFLMKTLKVMEWDPMSCANVFCLKFWHVGTFRSKTSDLRSSIIPWNQVSYHLSFKLTQLQVNACKHAKRCPTSRVA